MSSDEFCTLIGDEEHCDNINTTDDNNTENSGINSKNNDTNQEVKNLKVDTTALEIDIDTHLRQCNLTGNGDDINTEQTSSSKQCTLIGLHTCGDLASTMLKLFRKTEHIKNIVSVSCCYFRMTLKSEIGNKEMRNRDSNQDTVCCEDKNAASTGLCYCNFSLKTLHTNMKVLQDQKADVKNNSYHEYINSGGCKDNIEGDVDSSGSDINNSGDVYGFPLSDFIHRIPVTPLKYKSFETACHFLGDYADKLLG